MDTIPPLSLPILLDGATGSELYKRGMPAGACTEQWVLGHPEALLELQRGYVAAGSQVLIAPTFGANRVRLEQHGIFGQVADYNRRLVELSRQAAGGRALVAGDMAPTGLFIAPFGESSFEELVAIYTEQAAALAAAGVGVRLCCAAAAPVFTGLGISLVKKSGFGLTPCDILTLIFHSWLPRMQFRTVRMLYDGAMFLAGVLLGGTIGVGTVFSVLLTGPCIQTASALLDRTGAGQARSPVMPGARFPLLTRLPLNRDGGR